MLESSITLCSSPPHLIGRELQEVVAVSWGGAEGGGTNSCLPHISPHAFPAAMNVTAEQPITLECWADADPAPQFYWVTPTGDKVGVAKSVFVLEKPFSGPKPGPGPEPGPCDQNRDKQETDAH